MILGVISAKTGGSKIGIAVLRICLWGTAAAGGMFIGTVFGLIIIPGLYIFFATLENRKKA